VLEKLDFHIQEVKMNLYFISHIKINSGWVKNLNTRPEAIGSQRKAWGKVP
jgi:hypothetical protein